MAEPEENVTTRKEQDDDRSCVSGIESNKNLNVEGECVCAPDGLDQSTQITCDVLCSLMGSSGGTQSTSQDDHISLCDRHLRNESETDHPMCCPRQLQLPMFLSKTFHMISRADPSIAAWSESGDNFIIKDLDKFSASVLPLYFKHSNFSSFARQLNFYGFRKMRNDPILTGDVDPQTAGHVRFFHEKFNRDKPDLLTCIKRATKTDQQGKDELDGLRSELQNVRDALASTTAEYERRLAELSYDFNRRLSAINVEFDNLAAMVHRFVTSMDTDASSFSATGSSVANDTLRSSLHGLSHIAALRGANPFTLPPSAIMDTSRKRTGVNEEEEFPVVSRPRHC